MTPKTPKPGTIGADLVKLGMLKRRQKILARRLKQAKERAGKFEFEVYHRMLDEGFEPGQSNVKIQGVLYEPASTTFAQVTDRAALVAWLKDNTKILVKENPSKDELNQLVREKLDNGEEMPPGLTYFDRTRIGTRGLTAKDSDTAEEADDDEG